MNNRRNLVIFFLSSIVLSSFLLESEVFHQLFFALIIPFVNSYGYSKLINKVNIDKTGLRNDYQDQNDETNQIYYESEYTKSNGDFLKNEIGRAHV